MALEKLEATKLHAANIRGGEGIAKVAREADYRNDKVYFDEIRVWALKILYGMLFLEQSFCLSQLENGILVILYEGRVN